MIGIDTPNAKIVIGEYDIFLSLGHLHKLKSSTIYFM